MKYLRITGLCLATTFALCAVAANSAFAEKPEFLFPKGGTKRQFSSIESGTSKFVTRKGEEAKCTGGTDTGEITGPKQAKDILITYTGCTTKAGLEEYNCQSGATTGEIKTFDLLGRLGWIKKSENEVGILFNPETGKANNPRNLFAEFECVNKKTGGKNNFIKIKGSIIGSFPSTSINTLIEPGGTREFAEITFKETSGKPEIKNFEGEPVNQILTLSTFTTKEEIKETGGETGWIESGAEGTAKIFPLESMKICTE
jgi:hypothetical protein